MLKNEIKKLTSEYENFLVKLADSNQHKAANLYYWLKDYKIMLKREENFDPFFLKKYSRGDIVKALEDKAISLVKEGLEFIDKYSKSDKQEDFIKQVHERDNLILKMTGCANQIKNMKSGSIALIKQITYH